MDERQRAEADELTTQLGDLTQGLAAHVRRIDELTRIQAQRIDLLEQSIEELRRQVEALRLMAFGASRGYDKMDKKLEDISFFLPVEDRRVLQQASPEVYGPAYPPIHEAFRNQS